MFLPPMNAPSQATEYPLSTKWSVFATSKSQGLLCAFPYDGSHAALQFLSVTSQFALSAAFIPDNSPVGCMCVSGVDATRWPDKPPTISTYSPIFSSQA